MPAEDPSRHPGPLLRTTTEYAWRLLLIGVAAYLLLRVLGHLLEVIVPIAIALLLTALLDPLLTVLRNRRVPRGMATLATIIAAVVVIGGLLTLVVLRAVDQFPQLADEVNAVIPHLRHWLERGPLRISPKTVENLSSTISREVSRHSSTVISAATSTGKTLLQLATGLLLTFFIAIFFLYDGARIWRFVCLAAPTAARPRVDLAGRAAWDTLRQYVQGTLVVAVFHGVVIAIVLAILGVPLVLPLAVLVAAGSVVPIIGAVVTGLVAVGVAGVAHGLTAAIIVTVVLIADDQIEAHILQPFVVGRYVRIHPLATVLSLTAGGVLAGIVGVLFAVPLTACLSSAVRALVRSGEGASRDGASPALSGDARLAEPPQLAEHTGNGGPDDHSPEGTAPGAPEPGGGPDRGRGRWPWQHEP
ncbi:MAG: AI-2E family transporter [Acidimicrobiaceae bacterium]|nr:AI-2E family transporter [Acidimicrobiaceae bacterium]